MYILFKMNLGREGWEKTHPTHTPHNQWDTRPKVLTFLNSTLKLRPQQNLCPVIYWMMKILLSNINIITVNKHRQFFVAYLFHSNVKKPRAVWINVRPGTKNICKHEYMHAKFATFFNKKQGNVYQYHSWIHVICIAINGSSGRL